MTQTCQNHRSPGITAIFNEIKFSNSNRVLDLGSLVGSNFDFFSRLSCHLHYENLDDFIDEYRGLSGENQALRLESFLLKPEKNEKYDVILMWDLLNYLPLPAIKKLFEYLRRVCKNNTLVHLVKYLGRNIPVRPARFKIQSQYYLEIESSQTAPRQIQTLATAQLLKEAPNYYMQNNLMHEQGMAAGIAEQVMRFNTDKDLRKQFISRTEFENNVIQTGAISSTHTNTEPTKTATYKKTGIIYSSPAVERVMAQTADQQTLLDCGVKSSHNMDFWRKKYGRVYSEDLPSSLYWLDHANRLTGSIPKALSAEALQFDSRLKFDVIIIWDILNFCNARQITAIGERLASHCHQETQIVFIAYSGDNIPEHPQKYELADSGYSCEENAHRVPRSNPAATTASLMKLIPHWAIEKTFFHTPGMKPGTAELIFKPRQNR